MAQFDVATTSSYQQCVAAEPRTFVHTGNHKVKKFASVFVWRFLLRQNNFARHVWRKLKVTIIKNIYQENYVIIIKFLLFVIK